MGGVERHVDLLYGKGTYRLPLDPSWDVTVIRKPLRTIVKGSLVTDAAFPARSVTVPVAVRLVPGALKT